MNAPGTIPPFSFDVSRWGELPRLRGLFVTGTDTGVGKTLIAGAIARSLRRAGQAVEVFKPAATGCRSARGQLVSQDAEFLASCADSMRMLSEIAPVRYRTAVAPNVAAELEHRPVDLSLIFDAYKRIDAGRENGDRETGTDSVSDVQKTVSVPVSRKNGDRHHSQKTENGASPLVVVEGIGGLLCPIADDFWVIHLARMMALPLVIVARAGLGTINHTLLTLHAARSAGLRVAGVVLNRYLIDPLAGKSGDWLRFRSAENGACPPSSVGHETVSVPVPENGENGDGHHFQKTENGASPHSSSPHSSGEDVDMAMFTNVRQVEDRGRTKVLALVPEDPVNSIEQARIGPDTQFAIDQVDWARIGSQ
jgi:dethiobiotin synthetase